VQRPTLRREHRTSRTLGARDEHDARHLVHLLRLGLLKFGYIFPPEMRAVRDLARKRLQLVRSRTLHVLALETIVARQTGGHLGGNAAKKLSVAELNQWGWPDDVALAAQANVETIEAMERIIAKLEQRIRERRPTSHYATASLPSASTSARRRAPTPRWQPRHWPTN
jgi:hypothetical protein